LNLTAYTGFQLLCFGLQERAAEALYSLEQDKHLNDIMDIALK
jgi:hypothetical protein